MNLRIRRKKIKPILERIKKRALKCFFSGYYDPYVCQIRIDLADKEYKKGRMDRGSLYQGYREALCLAQKLGVLKEFYEEESKV